MGLAMSQYHTPVMLREALEGLSISPSGIYVDLTFGGGGHSSAILAQLNTGKLIAFDQDEDARENARGFTQKNFTFIDSNFRFFRQYLKMHGIIQVDGILADLGVSSFQIDTPERGFSTRFQSDLDMRMNPAAKKSALHVINEYPAEALATIFFRYGELRNAKALSRAITSARINKKIVTTEDLKEVLEPFMPRGREFKFLSKVFQAIRIEVNDELDALQEMLVQSLETLKPGGRLVVISYHSLEDRLVKNFMQTGNFEGRVEKDFYGNIVRPLDPVNRKPLVPTEDEIQKNKRARSAKLRIAEKK